MRPWKGSKALWMPKWLYEDSTIWHGMILSWKRLGRAWLGGADRESGGPAVMCALALRAGPALRGREADVDRSLVLADFETVGPVHQCAELPES